MNWSPPKIELSDLCPICDEGELVQDPLTEDSVLYFCQGCFTSFTPMTLQAWKKKAIELQEEQKRKEAQRQAAWVATALILFVLVPCLLWIFI